MPQVKRVTAQDIALAGSLDELIKKLVDSVGHGNMAAKEKGAMRLRSLTEQKQENVDLIFEAGAIKRLVCLIVNGSSLAQAHACVALANIAKGRPKCQEAIVEAGGVTPLASALRAGDSALQEQAAAAIASTSQLKASRIPFIIAGAIPPLLFLLKGGSVDTHVHICQTLANLAQGNSEGQATIARAGALPLLIALLGSGKAQEAAAHAVAELAQGNAANQAEVARLGGIPKLIALLTVMSMDAQAQAAAALAAVASGEIKDVVAKAGGLRPLLVLLESRYPSAERNAANALALLAQDHRANQDSIASMGGVMPLVKLTEHGLHTAEVQSQAVLALTEIARGNKEIQTAIGEQGAISYLVTLLRLSGSDIVEAEVAGAFWTLSQDHPQNKEAIAKAGAIPGLMTQLASKSERAHTNAAHALSSLASGHAENQRAIASLLVGVLEQASEGAQDRAAKSLWRLVEENPGNELMIAKAAGPEPLVRLLRTRLPAVQPYALWSLSLSIDFDSQKVVADAGGIEPLVGLLSEAGDENTSEQAACAIQRLATNNNDTQQAIAEQGAIAPLILLLRSEGETRSPEYAAAALSELSRIPGNRTAIDHGGGIPPLVALLGDSHNLQASKQHAAATLARLAAPEQAKAGKRPNSEQLQERIAEAGAIPPLVSLLDANMGGKAQEEAAGALLALAENEHSRKLMTEAGAIAPLVLLLGSTNDHARGHAEGALVRLSIEKATRAVIIQRLVTMLDRDRTTSAKEQATAALVNLARESTENRVSILEAGGIPKLLELLKDIESSKKVIENAVNAVSQLAYQNKKTQSAIAIANGVSILVKLLIRNSHLKDAFCVKLCELTAEAIWNLASDNKQNQTLFLKEGANPPLVTLVTHPISKLQTNAAGALAALSKDHPENQVAIAKSGAIPPICTNVRDGASETKEESAAAVWALATDNHANKSLIAQLGGVDPLIAMLLFGSTDKSAANAAGGTFSGLKLGLVA